MKKSLMLLVSVFFVFVTVGSSQAAVFNGHEYIVVQADEITWDEASYLAEVQFGGYLSTITSSEENDFITNLLGSGEYWVGGYQNHDAGTEVWEWVNGEGIYWEDGPVTGMYSNWNTGEPNDAGSGPDDEIFMAVWGLGGQGLGYWNDEGNLTNITGYVVERVVPVPSAILLLGSGLLGLCGFRRQVIG